MSNRTSNTNLATAPQVQNAQAPEAQTEAQAPVVVKNNVKATVQAVYLQQFDEQNYKTLSLMLNKPLKVMKESDSGLYEETTTQFLSLPVAAALADITDDVMNYFISVKGSDVESLKTALSGAAIEVDQKLFAAGETIDEITNETNHDQWFSFIKSVRISKMAKLVMAKQLGLTVEDLKMLTE